MVVSKRRWIICRLLEIVSSVDFWKGVMKGILIVLGGFSLVIYVWLVMWFVAGEDELKMNREGFGNKVKQETTYDKADYHS